MLCLGGAQQAPDSARGRVRHLLAGVHRHAAPGHQDELGRLQFGRGEPVLREEQGFGGDLAGGLGDPVGFRPGGSAVCGGAAEAGEHGARYGLARADGGHECGDSLVAAHRCSGGGQLLGHGESVGADQRPRPDRSLGRGL